MREQRVRPTPEMLLAELGERPRLIVYLGAAPGSGKTRRLLQELRHARDAGRDAVIGWIETRGRQDLERMAADLPRIPPRSVSLNGNTFHEFHFDAAIARKPQVIALDEVAHDNLPGSRHPTRWEDALALRDSGITVLCAFNVGHLESVAPAAERLTGYPLRALVPDRFLQRADEVVALDASPQLIQSRLRSSKVVGESDINVALQGFFTDRTLYGLRELLLHAVDEVTHPHVSAERESTAVVFVPPGAPVEAYVERTASVANALDLLPKVQAIGAVDPSVLEHAAHAVGAEVLSDQLDPATMVVEQLHASLIIIPNGKPARHLVNRHQDRDIFVIDPQQTFLSTPSPFPMSVLGGVIERARRNYGHLTVYLGAVAGCGKTYAMLERAHQLKSEGVDVVTGFIETHGRAETAALLNGLETVPRKIIVDNGIRHEELDREAVIARHPRVALIAELAPTNAAGSPSHKRYEDVLAILRAGIDVITTLNVEHLETLNDTIFRLTQTVVRETLPDGILALADEVILIDVTPQTLRQRLREGKIYPPERAERALLNFFTVDNLAALREIALREALRCRRREHPRAPFGRLLLCVGPRTEDVALIRRCSQIAARLDVHFAVAMITEPRDQVTAELVEALHAETRKSNARWHRETTNDPPHRIIELARMEPETVAAVAVTMRRPRWPQRNAFARRVLDAGARELFVLTRR